jgi:hypothetical protein
VRSSTNDPRSPAMRDASSAGAGARSLLGF